MAQLKLNEDDEGFLAVPQGAATVSLGASGTESWIEREKDCAVRIVLASVAMATADGASLEAVIEVGDAAARGQDGPAPAESRLHALQSIQVLVKPGERVAFKARPEAHNARVLRTVVYTADLR